MYWKFQFLFLILLPLVFGKSDDFVKGAIKPNYKPQAAQFHPLLRYLYPYQLHQPFTASPFSILPYGLYGQNVEYGAPSLDVFNNVAGRIINWDLFTGKEYNPEHPQTVKVPDPGFVPFSPSGKYNPDPYVLTNLTICYFIGNDIGSSHLQHPNNPLWNFDKNNIQGIINYLNVLTYQTNILLGRDNYLLKWKGPYVRSSPVNGLSKDSLAQDTRKTVNQGCDVVSFLLFNDFSSVQSTAGYKYSGLVEGAPCQNHLGKGYAVAVDQGYSGNTWVGPQIMAHQLLRLLTADICTTNPNGPQGWDPHCFCPNEESLLYPSIRPGQQYMDQCVVDKLNESNISLSHCLQGQ